MKRCDLTVFTERPTLTFATAIGYSSLDQITEQCKTVFFAMEPYSISTAITVHANLFYIFHESSVAEQNKELANSYLQYAEICKANMEAALSIINLLCNATPENIEALLLGVSWDNQHNDSFMAKNDRLIGVLNAPTQDGRGS